MNNRFVELFELAGISDSINEEFDIEYLAKLIVQDCIKLTEDFDGPKLSGPGMVIANRIRDQFGIRVCPCCGATSEQLCDDSCIWS